MPVKKKIGKHRKDKFYQLARDIGFRSRAAFKLIQLNRKFSFLEKSRVCIDLCAAPGGWMQVARKNMPISSIVLGVDLFPIQPIPGCIGLIGDITTDETAKNIEKELKTWKADVVLHDGAPKVGLNWLHDAYGQVCLTLSALKLATKFLRAGGTFVTKVFRSKDYNSLMWVFKQLFKKVHATKPSASRSESAEIFVVCQGYIAPDKLDPRFLDHKYVFEELNMAPTKTKVSDLLHPERKKKDKAEGYDDSDHTQHKTIKASEFIQDETGIELLAGIAEIIIEDDEIGKHPATTVEIRECCKDIKVLGRKDIRSLLAWWKTIRADLIGKIKAEADAVEVQEEEDDDEKVPVDEEEEEMKEVEKQIEVLTEEEKAEAKRKRRKANKERQKLHERMNLKMVLKGDPGPVLEGDDEQFDLSTITSAIELEKMADQAPEVVAESDESEDDTPKPKFEKYNVEKTRLDKSGMFYTEDDSEPEGSSEDEDEEPDVTEGLGFEDSDGDADEAETKTVKGSKKKKSVTFAASADDDEDEDDDQENGKSRNPLITDLDYRPKRDKRLHKAQLWFERDTFKDLTTEADEDFELDKLADEYRKRGGLIVKERKRSRQPVKRTFDRADQYSDDDDSGGSDYDVEQSMGAQPSKAEIKEKRAKKQALKDGFEVVPQDQGKKSKKQKLDEEGLALGALMVSSAKTKRDIVDSGWNRWAFNDENLPDWFVEDEKKFMKKEMPVPKEMVEEYKRRMQEINVRPIKKVIEAKARKKKRAVQKLEKAKKKLESLMDNVDMSDKEKAKQVRLLYKKTKDKKKDTTYVIAKKNGATRKMRRPPGVKGPYRVVDPRMKKDNRKFKVAFKKQGKKGKSTLPVHKKAVANMKKVQKVQDAARA